MSHERVVSDDEAPLSVVVAPQTHRHEARENSEITSLLTPVISGCVSAASTLLAPPPQGEMALAGAAPSDQPVPFVNPTCMKATCGGALLLAGLAGYAARSYMQGPPVAAKPQETWEASQRKTSRPTRQPSRKRQSPPVVRLLEECDEKPTGVFTANSNEIITLAMGQCGNRMNSKFWTDVYEEYQLDSSGKYTGANEDVDLERSAVYLNEAEEKWLPRSVLVDLDPSTADFVKGSPVGALFRPDNLVWGEEGTSNWAEGYYGKGREVRELALDRIRKEAEGCDGLQGMQIFQSLGGGTGSGMGSIMLESLRDAYPSTVLSTFSVLPTAQASDTVSEPYNAVMSLHYLIEAASFTYLIDNEALFNISQKQLQKKKPTYADFNHIANLSVMGATAPLRFSGTVENDLNHQNAAWVVFPRLKFLTLGQGPVMKSDATQDFVEPGTLVDQATSPTNFLQAIQPGGTTLAASLLYRGEGSAKFYDAVEKYRADGRESGDIVSWIPDCVLPYSLERAPLKSKNSCTMVANTTGTKQPLEKTLAEFKKLFGKKAFLPDYLDLGMSEDDFKEAEKNVRDLTTEYQDKQDASYDVEDDDDDAYDDDDDF